MEDLLQQFANPAADAVSLLMELAALIRPPKHAGGQHAVDMLAALRDCLAQNALHRRHLRRALLTLLGSKKQVPLYVETGILPGTGFFSELWRRVTHSVLPDVIDPDSLKDVLGLIFNRPSDQVWMESVPVEDWAELIGALRFDEEADRTALDKTLEQMLDAAQVISYRISSLGLEPEILRNEPSIEEFESPFLMQNVQAMSRPGTFSSTTWRGCVIRRKSPKTKNTSWCCSISARRFWKKSAATPRSRAPASA